MPIDQIERICIQNLRKRQLKSTYLSHKKPLLKKQKQFGHIFGPVFEYPNTIGGAKNEY